MVIVTCTVQLELHAVHSLKDKRSVVRYITKRLPKQFNVAIAEVDDQNVWRSSIIGMVGVGNDARYLHGLMEKAVMWIEQHRPDCELVDYAIEFR